MKFKLPIPYVFCILMSIGLGLLTGARQVYLYTYFFENAREGLLELQFWSAMLNQVLWGFLVPAVYWVYLKLGNRENRLRLSKGVLLGSIIVSAFHEFISYFIMYGGAHLVGFNGLRTDVWTALSNGFPAGFITQWIVFWIIYSIFAALSNARRVRENQVELANVQTQLSEARLNALKYQLQPHFFFNTLNTISSLMDFDVKDAQKTVARLGNLMRTILEKNAQNAIPLREELSFIKDYLGIEEMRFQDRLTVEYKIQDSVQDAAVPRLILQPLVENAVKHGLKSVEEDGKICIEAYELPENRIFISVSDNGIGSSMSMEEMIENGIGVKNVKDRLELMYRDACTFSVETAKGEGFKVTIEIPR
ncbi:MAG: two-component system LytT family sensor kinase [Saprospiraceae bacterium]|jgi:two-component system LytT family sensor kinase